MVYTDVDKADSAFIIPPGHEERMMEWAQAMTALYQKGSITWDDFKDFVLSMGCIEDPQSFKRALGHSKSIALQRVRNENRKEREKPVPRVPKYMQEDRLIEDGIENATKPKRKKATPRTVQRSMDDCPTCAVDEVCERCA